MKIQPYSKTQLALMYFPKSTKETARLQLMRWINRSNKLKNSLLQTGYSPNNKFLSPLQVKLIVEHLGEP